MKSLLLSLLLCAASAQAQSLDASLVLLCNASGVEETSAATQKAWRQAASASPDALPAVLSAMAGASPTGKNWLRSAADAIFDRAVAGGQAIPLSALRDLLEDQQQAPHARRTAYEYLLTLDPNTAEEYLPKMLDDPSLELRYDAVARVLDLADSAEGDRKAELLNQALASALNLGQLETCRDELKELGQQVNLTTHMGFLTTWKLIGPFDNTDEKGFSVAYPPEEKVDFNQTYAGKTGPVAWQAAEAVGELGTLDVTQTLGPVKGAVAYVYATFIWGEDPTSELRYTTHNASKVWINGKLICENEVYHAGDPLDQYRSPVRLKHGHNTILVKLCQNEQTDSWAQSWDLRLRFTDELGKGTDQNKVVLGPGAILTF